MWLTDEEIGKLPEHPTYGRPTKVHLSLGPEAKSRDEILVENSALQKSILAGDATPIKNFDNGTISFRKTYRSLRDLKWSVVKSFLEAAKRKLQNVWKTKCI